MHQRLFRGPALGFILCLSWIFTIEVQAFSAAGLVVPAANETTEGDSNDIGLLYTNAVTTVVVISASELTSIPDGSLITSISWRLDDSANSDQPAGDRNFSAFDVYLGEAAVTPSSMVNTVANNYTSGTRTEVRSGSLNVASDSIDAGDGTGGATAPFDFEITFDSAYAYNGGDLVLEYSHTGSGQGFVAFDGLTIPGPTTINQFVTLGYGATSAFQDSSVAIPQLTYVAPIPVPEPSTALFGILGGAALLLRRRRAS